MKIGMAGTGRMGAAIAQRLAGRGHQLTVWNRTADKARALTQVGAAPCARKHKAREHGDSRRTRQPVMRARLKTRPMHQPLSINVETFGTGKVPDDDIVRLINIHFDLRPGAIIRDLNLRRPIYRRTAAYGHFGRPEFPWEASNRVAELQRATA